MKTALMIICVIGGLLFAIGAVLVIYLAANFGYPTGVFQRTFITAEYDHMEFGGERSTMLSFNTGAIDHTIAKIYLKLPDDSIVFLPDLKKTTIEAFISDEQRHSTPTGNEMVRYTIGESGHARFVDDTFISFSLDQGSSLEISPTKDGTFIRLPLLKEKMIEIFGPPKSYRYSHPKPI